MRGDRWLPREDPECTIPSDTEEKHRRVTWHDNGRGPRVVIDIGGESVVTTADLARGLRDDLTAVLDEIDAACHARGAAP